MTGQTFLGLLMVAVLFTGIGIMIGAEGAKTIVNRYTVNIRDARPKWKGYARAEVFGSYGTRYYWEVEGKISSHISSGGDSSRKTIEIIKGHWSGSSSYRYFSRSYSESITVRAEDVDELILRMKEAQLAVMGKTVVTSESIVTPIIPPASDTLPAVIDHQA